MFPNRTKRFDKRYCEDAMKEERRQRKDKKER